MVSQGPQKVSQCSCLGQYLCRLDFCYVFICCYSSSSPVLLISLLRVCWPFYLIALCDVCFWLCVCWLVHSVETYILCGCLLCLCWLMNFVGTCGEMFSVHVSVGCCILSSPIVFGGMLHVCRLLQFVACYVVWMLVTFVLRAACSRTYVARILQN